MERSCRGMIPTIFMATMIAVLFVPGCAKKSIFIDGWPVRYQDVQVPGYQSRDYLSLLDADHEATRCNAICNLIPHAGEYGELLSRPHPDAPQAPKGAEDEEALRTARRVYEKVKGQMGGSSEACKAAALIFMAEFGATYSEHQEIADLVLTVETENAHTQYEQLNVLATLHERPYLLDPAALIRFLDSPDWIVRAMTYRFLAQMPCAALHSRLIQAYGRSASEPDRILIIHAFGQGYDGEVFDLLRREIQENRNQRIKGEWAGILMAYRDQAATRRWLFSGAAAIDAGTSKSVLDAYYERLASPVGQHFFQEMILSGQNHWSEALDLERFFRGFYNALSYGEKTDALVDLQAAVLGNDPLREQWLTHRARYDLEAQAQAARTDRDEHFSEHILPKYNLLLEKFLKDSENLFLGEGMDTQEADEATRDIRQLLEFLKEE